MDVAKLAIQVENKGTDQAVTSLKGLEVAGDKAEKSTQRLTRRMALAEIEARKMDAAMTAQGSMLGKLAHSMGITESAVSRLGTAFGALSALAVVGFIGRKTIEETEQAQAALAQMEAVLQSTGGAAGRSSRQLQDFATQMQRTTAFGDDAVIAMQSVLLTFTKIAGPEFDRAQIAIGDLATRMGGDLQGAAVQVGKALNDPINGVSALQRVGVSFTESQKEMIKSLVATGQVAEAQRLILKELETEFGGSAVAARDTLGGALAGLKNAWGDLFEVTRGASQGSVDAINAITKALEGSGISMNQQLTQMAIDWETMRASILKAKAVLLTPLSMTWAADVRAEMAKIDYELSVRIHDIRNPAKRGPAAGVGVVGTPGAPGTASDVARAAREARDIQRAADREREREQSEEIRRAQQYHDDIAQIWDDGMRDIARSTEQGFKAMVDTAGGFVGKLLERMAREGKSSAGLTGAGIGLAGLSAGLASGDAGAGMLSGAASGAAVGLMGGPVGVVAGTAIGALAGLTGGLLSSGKAAREHAQAMEAAREAIRTTLAIDTAELSGDARLAQELRIRAEYDALRKGIREAAGPEWSMRPERRAELEAQLAQADANEKQKIAALGAADALGKLTAGLNEVQGYKLQAVVFGAIGAGAGFRPTAPRPVPQQPISVTLVTNLDGKQIARTTKTVYRDEAQRLYGDESRWAET